YRKSASMTLPQPHLTTRRLLLRGFQLSDAPRVALLIGDFDIARMVSSIPHPYEEEMATEWIRGHESQLNSQTALHYAIVRQADHLLIGAIGLAFDWQNRSAELGYWIGKPYWNQGYATEAAQAVLKFAFGELGLNRVEAQHITKNPASGKVMQKLGMTYEGTLRQAIYLFGNFEDAALYSILRREFTDA
ncbi:MAG: GNAT family N-acetyltransferase, partial [Anaerolineales bacterium]